MAAATYAVPPPSYQEKDAAAAQWIAQPGEYRPIVTDAEADLGPPPTTIPNVFDSAYSSCSDDVVITTEPIEGRVANVPLDEWGRVTCAEMYNNAYAVARWLLSVGLEPHDRVAVIGESSVRERYIHFGTLLAGGVIAHLSLPLDGGVAACSAAAAHINARVVFCDIDPVAGGNVDHANAVVGKYAEEGLPLPTVVTSEAVHELTLPDSEKTLTTIMWDDVVEFGASGGESDKQLEERKSSVRPADVAVMVLDVSPHGATASMLSHDNLLYTATRFCDVYEITTADNTFSHVPLGNIVGMLIDVYVPLVSGAAVFLVSSHRTVKDLGLKWKKVEPTFLFLTSWLWEGLAIILATQFNEKITGMSKTLADWAMSKVKQANTNKREGNSAPWGSSFANLVLQSPTRKAMGVSKCRFTFTGLGSLSAGAEEFFLSLGIPLLHLFGDVGVSGFAVCATPGAGGARLCSVGKAVPGTEVRLVDPTSREPLAIPNPNTKSESSEQPATPEGVVAARGRHVFLGYYNNSKQSAEKFDREGFYHTGRIATMDSDCFVYQTGVVESAVSVPEYESGEVDALPSYDQATE